MQSNLKDPSSKLSHSQLWAIVMAIVSYPVLIAGFWDSWTIGCQEPSNEVGFLSKTGAWPQSWLWDSQMRDKKLFFLNTKQQKKEIGLWCFDYHSSLLFLVSHVSHALCALEPHALRALRALVPHVLSWVTCSYIIYLVFYVLSYVLSCFTCHSCLVPCVLEVPIWSFLLLFFHTSLEFSWFC